MLRRKYKHRGITLIQPGSRDWLEIKEICKLATEFSNEFEFSLKEGYKEYIEIGIKLMKSYSLSRFKYLHSNIYQRYELVDEIARDKYPDKTDALYKHYMKRVNQKIGWTATNIKDDCTKYVYFVRVRKEAEDIGIAWGVYIDAQFEGLEWANAIPDPSQMVGVKALERVMKFCYENNITLKPTGQKKIDFSKIKKQYVKGKNPNR
jgi:hypothetical protein